MGRVFEALQTIMRAFPASTVLQVEPGQVEVQEPDRKPVVFRFGPAAQIDQAAERADWAQQPLKVPAGPSPLPLTYYTRARPLHDAASPPDEDYPSGHFANPVTEPDPSWRIPSREPRRRNHILRADQIARRLGVAVSTIHRMVKRGDIPATRVSPRKIVFSSLAVEDWMVKGMPKGVQPAEAP